jgi:quercetin dioxygenase-like cupin family protein
MKSKSLPLLALAALGVATISVTTLGGTASATPSAGLTTTILAKSTIPDLDVRAHTQPADTWHLRLKTHGLTDGYVVDNVIAPGGTTGWHSHPGPSLIFVVRGTVTNYDSSDRRCIGHAYPAGSSFVDPGGRDVHMLRNNGDVPAETIAVQLLPTGAARRTDAPMPRNCAS